MFGVRVDRITLDEAAGLVGRWLADPAGPLRLVVTPNPEMLLRSRSDASLREVLNSASLATADGIGVVLAARLRGSEVPQRVSGIDLAEAVLALSRPRVFLLGGRPGVAERARARVAALGGRVVGTHHGFFTTEEEGRLVAKIAQAQADLVLVGLGSPRQELFLAAHRRDLRCRVGMGVGGCFDVWSGTLKRAPLWVQRAGMEWAFRLAQDPKRMARIWRLPLFLLRAALTPRAIEER